MKLEAASVNPGLLSEHVGRFENLRETSEDAWRLLERQKPMEYVILFTDIQRIRMCTRKTENQALTGKMRKPETLEMP